LTEEGAFQSRIVATLVESIEIPSGETIKPRNEVEVVKNLHFLPLINKLALANFSRTA
jgi:hypothetical protein